MPNFSKKKRLWPGWGEAAVMLIVLFSLRSMRPWREGASTPFLSWCVLDSALPLTAASC